MQESQIIEESLTKLINYIEFQNFRGYDPYDALKSPLFKLPVLRSNKTLRFSAQQFVKRFPFNLRPLLGIPKGYNPVTLGLCIQGYSYLVQSLRSKGSELRAQGSGLKGSGLRAQSSEDSISPSPSHRITPSQHASDLDYQIQIDRYVLKIQYLVNELKKLVPPGFHGACWGYDFDWEARHARIPAWQPTVVATGIITNALFIAYKTTGNKDCADLIKSSALFVLNDLKRTYSGNAFIFSYSPFDKQQVFNASMKGVRILAQAYEISGDENLKTEAKKAVEFVASKQHTDGLWGYSLASKGDWTDNYHTGYILDCLHEYCLLCNDVDFEDNLQKGYEFYKNHFIEKDGMPRFYNNDGYPADCTSAAQTILTLNRFGDREKAAKVAMWMIKYMQSKGGAFYFRKYRYYIIKTPFMRWSDAWMFAVLASLKSINS